MISAAGLRQGTLVPNISEVELICLRAKDRAIQLQLHACCACSVCPACGTGSRRVHSRYAGSDPLAGAEVLLSRRGLRAPYLHRTATQHCAGLCSADSQGGESLDWITLALGGQAGAHLARRLSLLASGWTLLRQVRRRIRAIPIPAPRVLGVDDWAWKKGHQYGTILCDLEAGKVVDLLPDRGSEIVAAWLREHPGAEIVSRDRASAYAEATRRASPQAVQIAGRSHLLRNLSEALRNALQPYHRTLTKPPGRVEALNS